MKETCKLPCHALQITNTIQRFSDIANKPSSDRNLAAAFSLFSNEDHLADSSYERLTVRVGFLARRSRRISLL
jgi:hypothetical protein